MTRLTRRGFLAGALAAPVVIRTPGLLMPVRAVPGYYSGGLVRLSGLHWIMETTPQWAARPITVGHAGALVGAGPWA